MEVKLITKHTLTKSMIELSTTPFSNKETLHIKLESDSVTYDPTYGFSLHMSTEDAHGLYLELKDVLLYGES